MRKPRNSRSLPPRAPSPASPAAAAETRTPAAGTGWPWYWYAALALLALFAAFEAYGPALRGGFLFDDEYLPFRHPEAGNLSLRRWMGTRPLLMLTFWVNYQYFNNEEFWYHLLNVLLHVGVTALVFLIVRRLPAAAGLPLARSELAAAFAAGVFLLHPLQTESVAYIASRSECLSVLFFYAAFALFLYRRRAAIPVAEAAGVVLLFAAAVLTKEHTAVLPALLLLTDFYFNPPFSLAGIRRNWRLYAPLALAALLGGLFVARVLRAADTAGFGVASFRPHEYFFTQCRVIWWYLRLFVLPYGQNVDPDIPVSRTLADHGAWAGAAALLAVAVLAWILRRRFPLASFGVLAFFLLLAPTSSFVPILDVAAERRMYLPMLGLLLVIAEFILRARLSTRILAAGMTVVLVALSLVTWQRSQVWANGIALWQDSSAKSPRKVRPRFQLAYAYYTANQCPEAAGHYAAAAGLAPPDYRLLLDWALALDCAGRPAEAVERLQQAIALNRTAHAYSLVGMIQGKQGRYAEALSALNAALSLDPGFDITWAYRGNVYASMEDFGRAAADYRTALRRNPQNVMAIEGLRMVERRLQQQSR